MFSFACDGLLANLEEFFVRLSMTYRIMVIELWESDWQPSSASYSNINSWHILRTILLKWEERGRLNDSSFRLTVQMNRAFYSNSHFGWRLQSWNSFGFSRSLQNIFRIVNPLCRPPPQKKKPSESWDSVGFERLKWLIRFWSCGRCRIDRLGRQKISSISSPEETYQQFFSPNIPDFFAPTDILWSSVDLFMTL